MCKFFYSKSATSGFVVEHTASIFFLNLKTKTKLCKSLHIRGQMLFVKGNHAENDVKKLS